MTSGHPQKCAQRTKFRSVGVGTTGTETTGPQESPNRSFTLSEEGAKTDIIVQMFRSVETQTVGKETCETGSGGSLVSTPEHAGTQVERPFLAPPGYPTSKLSRPLPSPTHMGTQVERPFLAPPGYTSKPPSSPSTEGAPILPIITPPLPGAPEKDLQWLKWATGKRSPPLVAFVNSIVSASKKRRAEFLRVNRTVKLPRDYSDSWFAPVGIGGRNFFFLCDTGSAATIITSAVYKRIPSQYKTPLLAPDFTLRNASADGVPVSGLCCLEMGLGPE